MKTVTEQFEDKYCPEPNTGCWLWFGATRNGYGAFLIRGHRSQIPAHRWAYEHFVGPIPEGLTLDHYRLNPGPRNAPCSLVCVNPEHLEPVTRSENSRRNWSRIVLVKVTLGQAAEIRERLLQGQRQIDIARELGISKQTISAISTGVRRFGTLGEPGSFSKGKAAGERNGRAKRVDVNGIRAARVAGTSFRELAKMFGVSKTQVQRIVRGDNWQIRT
jgi:transposase